MAIESHYCLQYITEVTVNYSTTVKPLHCGHHWDQNNCSHYFRGKIICSYIYKVGTQSGVPINRVSVFQGCPLGSTVEIHM